MPICTKCRQGQPIGNFHRKGEGAYRRRCKACRKVDDRKRWFADVERNRARNRVALIRRRYGLTTEEHEALFQQHGNRCAVCGSPDDLHVDHCHVSGKIRGILCGGCNRAIGGLQDDPSLLLRAAAYLLGKTLDPVS
jgi:hypothetical protein